jgi:hypothetical protein
MFSRVQLYVATAASLTLGGLVLGTWAIAKDGGPPAHTAVVQSRASEPVAKQAARTDKAAQRGLSARSTDWSPGLKPRAPLSPKQGPGLGYGLHAGSVQPGRASIREASAGLAAGAAQNSATLSTPLSVGGIGAFRPPLDNQPVHAGSLRADIARYSAERSGHGQPHLSQVDSSHLPQTYAPNLYSN